MSFSYAEIECCHDMLCVCVCVHGVRYVCVLCVHVCVLVTVHSVFFSFGFCLFKHTQQSRNLGVALREGGELW